MYTIVVASREPRTHKPWLIVVRRRLVTARGIASVSILVLATVPSEYGLVLLVAILIAGGAMEALLPPIDHLAPRLEGQASRMSAAATHICDRKSPPAKVI